MEFFSINMVEMIHMSIDTTNGNLNLHFLKRLLEGIMIHTNLDKYDMDFKGFDALRAQTVYTGVPDNFDIPFTGKCIITRQNKDEDYLDAVPISNENLRFGEEYEIEPQYIIKPKNQLKIKSNVNRTFMMTETDKIEHNGALNLRVLKQIQEMMNPDRTFGNRNALIRGLNDDENGTDSTIEQKVEGLTRRLNEFENSLEPINSDGKPSKSIGTDKNNSSLYAIRRQPKKIRLDSSLLMEQFAESEETSALNVLHHTVESPLIQLRSSQQNMVNETEDGNCSREQTTDNVKNAHCNIVEKYLPKTFAELDVNENISRMLEKLDKLEHKVSVLLKNTALVNEVVGTSSNSDCFSCSDSDVSGSHYILTKNKSTTSLSDVTEQDKKLMLLAREKLTTFQRVYGEKQLQKDLKANVTVKNFRTFFDNYSEKFEIIHDFLTLYKNQLKTLQKYTDELFDNKVDLNEYESFKRLMFDKHHKMKDDIEEYILRDPEAAGIVHYVKGVTCVSCAKPCMMRTTHESLKHPTKGVSCPRPNLRITCQLQSSVKPRNTDRTTSQFERSAVDKDLRRWETLVKTIERKAKARKCDLEVDKITNSKQQTKKYKVREIIRITPLERWKKQFSAWDKSTCQIEPPSEFCLDEK